MKEIGLMIKLTGLVVIITAMVLHILVSGKMINNMVMGRKLGQMVLNIKENTKMGKSMEMENYNLLIIPFMRENLNKTTFMEKVFYY